MTTTTPNIKLVDLLSSLGACQDAIEWAESLGPGQIADETAWLACQRGDWMLWVAGRLGVPRPTLVLAACACARESLVYVEAGEERPRLAIEAAESWARGGDGAATIGQVRAAACAADAADAAAAAAYAADAADAAAAAAYAAAADAAACAADAAAAAYAAAADAADAAAYAARSTSLSKSSALVREVIQWSVVSSAITESFGQ